jgi:hypothetical protein
MHGAYAPSACAGFASYPIEAAHCPARKGKWELRSLNRGKIHGRFKACS